jgi:hypothetical protein
MATAPFNGSTNNSQCNEPATLITPATGIQNRAAIIVIILSMYPIQLLHNTNIRAIETCY